jgi:hypothetical protein
VEAKNTYILIKDIDLVDKSSNTNQAADVLYSLREGCVYRADVLFGDGDETTYVIYLDEDKDCENGILINKKALNDPDFNVHPVNSLEFDEISFSNLHEFGVTPDQLLKMVEWEQQAEFEEQPEEEEEEKTIKADSRDRLDHNERISMHPAYTIPLSFLKLKLYELRDANPDLFLSIAGVIKNSLK